jgi:hypothetical protein
MHPEITAACARLHIADLARDAAERRRRPARRPRLRVTPGRGLPQ